MFFPSSLVSRVGRWGVAQSRARAGIRYDPFPLLEVSAAVKRQCNLRGEIIPPPTPGHAGLKYRALGVRRQHSPGPFVGRAAGAASRPGSVNAREKKRKALPPEAPPYAAVAEAAAGEGSHAVVPR